MSDGGGSLERGRCVRDEPRTAASPRPISLRARAVCAMTWRPTTLLGRGPDARGRRGRRGDRGRGGAHLRAAAGRSRSRAQASVWAQELDLMAPTILERLNERLGERRITRLRCVASLITDGSDGSRSRSGAERVSDASVYRARSDLRFFALLQANHRPLEGRFPGSSVLFFCTPAFDAPARRQHARFRGVSTSSEDRWRTTTAPSGAHRARQATTPRTSRSSRDSRRSASVPACTSARPGRAACTTSSTRLLTTLLTRRWPATATASRSRSIPTTRSRSSTTAAASRSR